MNKSIKILEALNDIEDNLINYNFEEYKNLYQKSNIKILNFCKIKYILTPVVCMAFLIVGIVLYDNKNNSQDNEIIPINEIAAINEIAEEKNDIKFSNNNLKTTSDIDGKSIKKDIISQFEFLSKLAIPESYNLIYQTELYEKNDISDLEYTKLWQYNILYEINGPNENDVHSIIEISFTKEDHILSCMLPDKNTFPVSKINGTEIYLFNEDTSSIKQAFFEYDGYKFFIEASKLSEEEFINLISSIIK